VVLSGRADGPPNRTTQSGRARLMIRVASTKGVNDQKYAENPTYSYNRNEDH